MRLLRGTFLGLALLLAASSLPAQPTPSSPSRMSDFSTMLQEIVDRSQASVVQVLTRGFAEADENEPGLLHSSRGTGSGVVVDPAGYIVTNAHVVGAALTVRVLLPETAADAARFSSVVKPSGRMLPARVVGTDRETDIAVLKVEAENLPHLEFANSDLLRQGQVVVAFGSPFGLQNSVSMGIVSSVARQVGLDNPMIYVQTDAAINPGNSGGPLINAAGNVVGINTFILSSSGANDGVGFAVPANIARIAYQQIRKDGRVRRGQIGVIAQTITSPLAQALSLPQAWGVILADVVGGGAAAAADLQPKDIILSLNGKAMENSRQFGVNIYQHAGETITLEILRNGETLTKRVAVLERPRDPDRIVDYLVRDQSLIQPLGILAVNLSPEVIALLPEPRRFSGAAVAGVIANYSLDENSLRPGDVIYELNNQRVADLPTLRELALQTRAGQPIALLIERMGQIQFLLLERP